MVPSSPVHVRLTGILKSILAQRFFFFETSIIIILSFVTKGFLNFSPLYQKGLLPSPASTLLFLLCIVYYSALPDHAYLDLTRILQLCLDLLRNISRQEHHIRIVYLIWNYHYPNFPTCLNSK